VIGITTAIGVVAVNRDVAPMIEQPVKDIEVFARRRGDHLGVERNIAVGEVRVEFASGVIARNGR
jgi:hypothetical protein